MRVGARLRSAAPPAEVRLTDAERDVLARLGAGASDAGIAQARGTTVHTVRKQVASLREKRGARSRGALASFADSP
ncbi:MAG: hypothetical protein ABW252_08765 [Polyangiales bacterium]